MGIRAVIQNHNLSDSVARRIENLAGKGPAADAEARELALQSRNIQIVRDRQPIDYDAGTSEAERAKLDEKALAREERRDARAQAQDDKSNQGGKS